jgi:hypothetical protein
MQTYIIETYKTSLFSDVDVNIRDEETNAIMWTFKLHKYVLGSVEFFKKMLTSGMKESSSSVIDIKFKSRHIQVGHSLFDTLFKYIYGKSEFAGEDKIKENVYIIYEIADRFQYDILTKACESILCFSMTTSSFMDMLEFIKSRQAHELKKLKKAAGIFLKAIYMKTTECSNSIEEIPIAMFSDAIMDPFTILPTGSEKEFREGRLIDYIDSKSSEDVKELIDKKNSILSINDSLYFTLYLQDIESEYEHTAVSPDNTRFITIKFYFKIDPKEKDLRIDYTSEIQGIFGSNIKDVVTLDIKLFSMFEEKRERVSITIPQSIRKEVAKYHGLYYINGSYVFRYHFSATTYISIKQPEPVASNKKRKTHG